MTTTIKLHGWIGKKYGKTFKMNVQTPAQAVGLLRANFKDFTTDLLKFSGGYRVHVGKESITQNELTNTCGNKTIHIIPIISGSGNGTGQIIVGAALVWASAGTSLLVGGALGMSGAATGLLASAISSFGMSLVLGGVMQMLTPTQKAQQFSSESANNKPSFMFNGPVNTVGQGNGVPLLYGELLVGSQVISAGLSTRQI